MTCALVVMPTLVIHVGAQKCGSTTVQNAFANFVSSDYKSWLKFKIFPPELASRMHRDFSSVASREVDVQLAEICEEDNCLILSCESLCNYPDVVAKLAKSALNLVPNVKIVVIGYIRTQFSYYLSEYKQWFFRARARLREDINFFSRNDLLPNKFLPHERRMFVNAVKSFEECRQRDWYDYYQCVEDLIADFDANGSVLVKSSHIPTKQLNYSLIEDFLEKVNLEGFDMRIFAATPRSVNASFNPLFCESIALHICDNTLDSSHFPGPHDGNELISEASSQFNLCQENVLWGVGGAMSLCQAVKSTVAANFAESNKEYCCMYNIDRRYFESENSNAACSTREELLVVARQIQDSRDFDEIRDCERQLLRELSIVEFIFK